MIADALKAMPLVAILRGIKPVEVAPIAGVLYEHGLRCIEVPLNSPSPFDSIRELARSLPDDCVVGAGTVINADDVVRVQDAGGKLIVMPNTSEDVIKASLAADMQIAPGFATATEAFRAVQLGATYLKLFPASTYGSGHLRALLAVLPKETRILAVGGIGPQEFAEWREAGVVGFGIGSELYHAGDSVADVREKVRAICAEIK
ncbi:MAG: 2-dehydro-3-deoxy-6-phosphogalactonate aldolase [Woeseiaceae bacterium]